MSNSAGHVRNQTVQRSARHLNPSIINPFTAPPPALRLSLAERYLSCSRSETRMSRLRNFDTEPPSSYCYELQPKIARKASLTRAPPPICAFAPGSQTALIWRAVGRCERINSYIMAFFPQQQDSKRPTAKPPLSAQNRAAACLCCSKVLNLCGDSMTSSTVTFLAIAKNKFINR
jgi:hypothetical protein